MTIVKKQPPSYYDVHDANDMRMRVSANGREIDSQIHSFTQKCVLINLCEEKVNVLLRRMRQKE